MSRSLIHSAEAFYLLWPPIEAGVHQASIRTARAGTSPRWLVATASGSRAKDDAVSVVAEAVGGGHIGRI